MNVPFSIAIAGKGGTGKTTISALLVRSFVEAGKVPVLAVDADPNANLHEALGIRVGESLGGMREEAFTRSIPPGMTRQEYIRYRFRQVLVEGAGFDLLVMGRPEGSGCYCFANDLLRSCMCSLEREYQFVVIDSEAGMEHISRGTIGKPDLILIVTDPGARGMRTAERIREIALSLGLDSARMHLIVNRFKGETSPVDHPHLQTIVFIPEDPAVQEADLAGTPIAAISGDSPAMHAIRELAEKIIRTSRAR